MKLFRSKQIAEIDSYTIKNEPVASIDLMERASNTIAQEIINTYTTDKRFIFFIGTGNNGGDGLAVARLIAERKYQCEAFILKITENLSHDAEINLKRLRDQNLVRITEIKNADQFPVINLGIIIVDALFGSGLSRPIEGLAAETVKHINTSGAEVIAIDIPSGLFGEDNSANLSDHIIKANFTFSLQFPKIAFFFAENEKYVGSWKVLPIGLHKDAIEKTESQYFYITKELLKGKFKQRSKFAHKGNFGHALLISGSYGKMGAAVLASKSCLRTGVGLLTTHVPKFGYEIIQTAVPEAMVSVDSFDKIFSSAPELIDYSAIGIGPGIGMGNSTRNALKDLIDIAAGPLLFDADAINILGESKACLDVIPAGSVFTPHPKEFERLTEKSADGYARHLLQIDFARRYNVYVVLKGAYTSVACPDGTCWFNSTGNPGMATAGSGDVLTGIILSLLAQGFSPKEASLFGVYVHGLAGDMACREKGEESMVAGDIVDNLGMAFREINR